MAKKERIDVGLITAMVDEYRQILKQRDAEEALLRDTLEEALDAYKREMIDATWNAYEEARSEHMVATIRCRNIATFIGNLRKLLAKDAASEGVMEYE